MQHGRHWSGQGLARWYATEKLRGARAFWDGAALWSRGGRAIAVPAPWAAQLPPGFALDCELWAGYGPEQGEAETHAGAVMRGAAWSPRLRLVAFDAPGVCAPWIDRLAAARERLTGASLVSAVEVWTLRGLRDAEAHFARIVRAGGEGLMVRDPRDRSLYAPGRTGALRKIKTDPALARGVVRVLAPVDIARAA